MKRNVSANEKSGRRYSNEEKWTEMLQEWHLHSFPV